MVRVMVRVRARVRVKVRDFVNTAVDHIRVSPVLFVLVRCTLFDFVCVCVVVVFFSVGTIGRMSWAGYCFHPFVVRTFA